MQWTIDPRDITSGRVSPDVAAKAIRVFEATPRVIVRTSRRGFRVPSWTHPGRAYGVVITAAPDGWSAVCQCDADGWCHHGYAAALLLADLDGLEIPEPRRHTSARKTRRSRPLTVIPGGKAS